MLRPSEVEGYSISYHVASSDGYPFQVQLGVEHFCVDQVWVQRILVLVLPPRVNLPIMFFL